MIKFTLHDIFGYLFPGTIVLVAIGTLLCAAHPPSAISVLLLTEKHWLLSVLLLLFAYSLGHIVAEVSRKIMPCLGFEEYLNTPFNNWLRNSMEDILKFDSRIDKAEKPPFDSCLVDWLRRKYDRSITWCSKFARSSQKTQKKGEDIKERICDEYNVQFGGKICSDTRDLFYYRIDFYRGTALSLTILAASALVCLICGISRLWMRGTPALDRALLIWVPAVFFVPSVVGSWTSFRRFCRFDELRVQLIAINFLILRHEKGNEESVGRKPIDGGPSLSSESEGSRSQ